MNEFAASAITDQLNKALLSAYCLGIAHGSKVVTDLGRDLIPGFAENAQAVTDNLLVAARSEADCG